MKDMKNLKNINQKRPKGFMFWIFSGIIMVLLYGMLSDVSRGRIQKIDFSDFMNRVEMVLSIMLLVSVGINILLFVYSRTITDRLARIAVEIVDLRETVTSFANHLKSVYELEMFYGDQTLQALMDHARSFRDYMDQFEYVYILDEEEQEEPEEEQAEDV